MATKIIPNIRESPYEERLAKVKLPALWERRDFIIMFKGIKGLGRVDKEHFLARDNGKARECEYKILKITSLNNVKKFTLQNRIIDNWNVLEMKVERGKNIRKFIT